MSAADAFRCIYDLKDHINEDMALDIFRAMYGRTACLSQERQFRKTAELTGWLVNQRFDKVPKAQQLLTKVSQMARQQAENKGLAAWCDKFRLMVGLGDPAQPPKIVQDEVGDEVKEYRPTKTFIDLKRLEQALAKEQADNQQLRSTIKQLSQQVSDLQYQLANRPTPVSTTTTDRKRKDASDASDASDDDAELAGIIGEINQHVTGSDLIYLYRRVHKSHNPTALEEQQAKEDIVSALLKLGAADPNRSACKRLLKYIRDSNNLPIAYCKRFARWMSDE